MDAKQLADMLDGREYGQEMTDAIFAAAKMSKMVIVFGASDDIMIFRGAITCEVDCFDGGTACLNYEGLIKNKCDNEDCPYFQKLLQSAITIEAVWNTNGNPCWTYETAIPHETFDIVGDGDIYCRGIVFHMDALKCLFCKEESE